eukprot:CAMPEP_0172400606 /NCGR_PEP_ID=MMETSP1061-20121228/46811_1 /TAXON_ID=37318 /ORGANISM="Pseudo-nitzschia pungens, Strain cf. pungens" /LENGTH=77 /DNA_ID=CAMNT_0013133937 /DNA_START=3 /DNA_END=233 /DNA_ORIENTATION=-
MSRQSLVRVGCNDDDDEDDDDELWDLSGGFFRRYCWRGRSTSGFRSSGSSSSSPSSSTIATLCDDEDDEPSVDFCAA